jgi:hypothetical protein
MTVEGPIAYIETTTRPRINDENATRCFELYLDESEEQTRRIHERQKESKTLGGLKKKTEQEGVIRRHHNMQRLLSPVRVVTPYAHLIDFPARWLRTRRDHQRFFNLIEGISFLYQHQREIKRVVGVNGDEVPYIESTVEDYEKAFHLARHVLGESFTELKKPQRELLMKVEALCVEKGGGVTRRPNAPAENASAPVGTGGLQAGITRREIRESTGLADTRLRELLADLVSLEYLRQMDGGGRGNTCRYVVTERITSTEKMIAGLTTPEELSRLWRADCPRSSA